MIFYHFTDFRFLRDGGTILQEGLKGRDEDKDYADRMMAPPDAVWLTTDTEETWRVDRKSEYRITVVIPSTDKKLVRWDRWMRKHHPPDIAERLLAACAQMGNSAWKNYWLYLGPVPLSRFRAIEHADPQKRAEAESEEELQLHPERRAKLLPDPST
jgi:hypothetical protein